MDISRKRLRQVILICGGLLVLVCLGVVLSGRSQMSAWEQYKAELAARGESLDSRDEIPEFHPPDVDNFGATPLLRAIGYRAKVDSNVWERITALSLRRELGQTGDWMRGQRADLSSIQQALRRTDSDSSASLPEPAVDVLAALEPLRAEFEELRGASKRRYAQLDLSHDTPFNHDIPNYVALRSLAQLESLRACAELALGKTDDAFADLNVTYRLAELTRTDPTLVGAMIYCAMRGLALQTFWEGWVDRKWSGGQLQQLQNEFAKVRLLAAYDHAMRSERTGVNYLLQNLNGRQLADTFTSSSAGSGIDLKAQLHRAAIRFSPPSLRTKNLLYYDRFLERTAFVTYDLKRELVFPAKCAAAAALRNQAFNAGTVETYLTCLAVPNFTRALETIARTQSFLDQAQVVCALERYREAHEEYPSSLDQLLPEFIGQLPRELIGGANLNYRRITTAEFVLYSVGWNERDDGGDNTTGDDWSWPVAPEG